MEIPIRLLNIAKCGDGDSDERSPYNLNRMKLERIDGHNVAMATDGRIGIVSATKTEEVGPCNIAISMKDADLAVNLGLGIGAETAEVTSQDIDVGGAQFCLEPSEGRFPDPLDETVWPTYSDDEAVSVVVDIKLLRKLVTILSDAMPDDERQAMVMTVPLRDHLPITFAPVTNGELIAGVLHVMDGSNIPAWKPSDLKMQETQPDPPT